MEEISQAKNDLAEVMSVLFTLSRLMYKVRQVEKIDGTERLSIAQTYPQLQTYLLHSQRVVGSSSDHFYSAFVLALMEHSFALQNPLDFWEQLSWQIDGHPVFDKRDSLQGAISLHFFDMIQAQLKSRAQINAHPMEPMIHCLYNKLVFTPFLKDLVRLLQNFTKTYVEFYPEEHKTSNIELVKLGKLATPTGLKPDPNSLLPSAAICRALASTFQVRLIILDDQQPLEKKPSLLEYIPDPEPEIKLFKDSFFNEPIILSLSGIKGWRILYSESQKYFTQILNYNLLVQKEQIMAQRPFIDKNLLQFLAINCGCCPHIRRATVLSYLDHHFPPPLVRTQLVCEERRFFKWEDEEVKQPLCPKGSPLPYQTLHAAFGQSVGVQTCERVYQEVLQQGFRERERKKRQAPQYKSYREAEIQRPKRRSLSPNSQRCFACFDCVVSICCDTN